MEHKAKKQYEGEKCMKKVIIFNGPPSSGKDTFGQEIAREFKGSHQQFKDALFIATEEHYGLEPGFIVNNYDKKEDKFDELDGMTIREALIHVSENVIKPRYGLDYFGKKSAKRLSEGLNVFTDGGFEEELNPIIDSVGLENVLIFRLHRTGCSFKNDSRNYLQDREGLLIYDIYDVWCSPEVIEKEKLYDDIKAKVELWLPKTL